MNNNFLYKNIVSEFQRYLHIHDYRIPNSTLFLLKEIYTTGSNNMTEEKVSGILNSTEEVVVGIILGFILEKFNLKLNWEKYPVKEEGVNGYTYYMTAIFEAKFSMKRDFNILGEKRSLTLDINSLIPNATKEMFYSNNLSPVVVSLFFFIISEYEKDHTFTRLFENKIKQKKLELTIIAEENKKNKEQKRQQEKLALEYIQKSKRNDYLKFNSKSYTFRMMDFK